MTALTRLRISVLVAALLLAVIGGWALSRRDDSAGDTVILDTRVIFEQPSIETNSVVEGTPLPGATVQNLEGDDVTIESLIGRPMVINIWGSTCGPCRKELPDFAAVHLQYGDAVRFVGIDYLPASDREEEFARSRGVQYELLYDGTGEFIAEIEVAVFPVTLFVDATGRIVRQTGQLDAEQLIAFIESDLL